MSAWKRMIRTTLLLAISWGLVLSAGCKDEEDDDVAAKLNALAKKLKGAGKGGGGGGADSEDKALGAKLDHYIKCINQHARRIADSRKRYMNWVANPEEGPTCRERYIYGLYKLTLSPDRCVKGVKTAKAMKPSLPKLEKAADGYAATLQVLEPLMRKANRYYEQKDYKDDACEKGRKFHAQLMQAWNDFRKHEIVVRGEVRRHNNALQERELGRIAKKFGKGLRYYKQRVMVDARKMLNVLRVQAAEPQPNVELIRKAIGDFQNTAEAMEATSDKMKAQVSKVFWWSRFKSETFDLLKASKEFMRRRVDGKKYSRFERRRIARGHGWMVKGHFGKVLREYNELVRASNSVRFRFR